MSSQIEAAGGQDVDPSRILEERAARLANRRRDERDEGELRLVAQVGDHSVGIPLASARHVLMAPPLASVPGTGSAIAGLAVVLGQLVPVADLGPVLDVQRPERMLGGWLVVLDDGDDRLGLLVDRIVGITAVGPDDLAMGAAARPSPLVAAVGPAGMLLLDLPALLGDVRLGPAGGGHDHPDEGAS